MNSPWALTNGPIDRLALAPMEGISDALVRDLLSRLGCMDACVTEFIRVTDRPLNRKVLRRKCPELEDGGRTSAGTPVFVQLLGSDEAALGETAGLAAELGAPGVDLNFGCPARRVNGHDGGAALLRHPVRLERIMRAVRDAVPSSLPVSAKVRLGWDDPDEVFDIVRAAEGGGASFVTIHGRTKTQMYKPSADWSRIGRAARCVGIPVVANGDIFSPDDAARCVAETGCSSLMLGRGAFRTPNLFRWVRGLDTKPWSGARSAQLLREFVGQLPHMERFRNPQGVTLARLKQWLRALGETSEAMNRCFHAAKRSQNLKDALAILDTHFPADDLAA